MKRSVYLLLIPTIILAACGGGDKSGKKAEAELTKLKKERAALDEKISKLEAQNKGNDSGKATPVSVLQVQPQTFSSYVEVQANVNGEQNVTATPQAPGIVQSITVKVGQHVSKGQILARLDAAAVEQQIKGIDAQVALNKSLYERQQKLWAQNIGTEVQLLSAKTQYEATSKQRAALIAQRDMYTIKSPISGVVDAVNVKEGDIASPGNPATSIRVVNSDALKVQANLGENYLGQVNDGDPVNLVFEGRQDTMRTKLTYVSKAVDPISRAFQVEVRLGNNSKLHPNMSCKMQIANYQNNKAIVIPVNVIQKTADGEMVFIADGNKAKSVMIKTGRSSNGYVEVLSGLNPGDKVITEGYEEVDNGEQISVE